MREGGVEERCKKRGLGTIPGAMPCSPRWVHRYLLYSTLHSTLQSTLLCLVATPEGLSQGPAPFFIMLFSGWRRLFIIIVIYSLALCLSLSLPSCVSHNDQILWVSGSAHACHGYSGFSGERRKVYPGGPSSKEPGLETRLFDNEGVPGQILCVVEFEYGVSATAYT
ncbi:hypothetical protein LY76DRAFT_402851 [Colletotrichum caudatum]|nr:hypothetical protein LY76DRAFT_402851 [Colletotrichum caudatum]